MVSKYIDCMSKQEIASLISRVRSGINKFLIKELKRYDIAGLAPSHGAILHHLFTHRNVTMKDLAQAVQRDKSTVTSLVGKLVNNGYVRKVAVDNDQRSIEVMLTAKGEQIRPLFMDIAENLIDKIWEGISEDEKEKVIMILNKIKNNVE